MVTQASVWTAPVNTAIGDWSADVSTTPQEPIVTNAYHFTTISHGEEPPPTMLMSASVRYAFHLIDKLKLLKNETKKCVTVFFKISVQLQRLF